jgi:hypothetical protein
MPPRGHTAPQKRLFLRLISTILTEHPLSKLEDVKYALKSSPYREHWVEKYKFPGDSTLAAHFTSVRKTLTGAPDRPWTIGATIGNTEYSVRSESLPTVMLAYRRCIAIDREFSVRHAYWVDHLSGLLPLDSTSLGDRVQLLLTHATEYSARQIAAESSGELLNTSDLDAELAFGVSPVMADSDGHLLHAARVAATNLKRISPVDIEFIEGIGQSTERDDRSPGIPDDWSAGQLDSFHLTRAALANSQQWLNADQKDRDRMFMKMFDAVDTNESDALLDLMELGEEEFSIYRKLGEENRDA